jgi:serine/threonine protein phosphatase PrpC
MQLASWARSETGPHRQNNEDAILSEPQTGLFILADGVGGGAAGEVASQLAVSTIRSSLRRVPAAPDGSTGPMVALHRDHIMKSLRDGMAAAAEAVWRTGQERPECRGMSTTAIALQFIGDHAIATHVGDSRLYLVRDSKVYQLTEDHTLVAQLVAMGTLTAESAKTFPHRNVLAKAIGMTPTVEPDVIHVEAIRGDRFVLCSDGVSDALAPERIRDIAAANKPREAVDLLIAAAIEGGSKDNCSAIVVEVQGEQQRPSRRLATQERIHALSRVSLFRGLSVPQIVRVLRIVEEINLPDGEYICHAGEAGKELFIIAGGKVAVMSGGAQVATLEAGEHFGEMAIFGRGVRTATVRADGPVRLLALAQEPFYRLVAEEPHLGIQLLYRVVQLLADRLQDRSRELAELLKVND